MVPPPSDNITALLAEASLGDPHAARQLWEAVYADLRQIAHRELRRRRPGQTLQTTALVHEAYLRLADRPPSSWQGRLQFFGVAALAMRYILVDYARRQHRQKRGGGQPHLPLDEAVVVADERAEALLALDEALTRLAARDARLAQVVDYRFFGGLTEAEVAQLFGVSERTVRRDWRKARAWLSIALDEPPDDLRREDPFR